MQRALRPKGPSVRKVGDGKFMTFSEMVARDEAMAEEDMGSQALSVGSVPTTSPLGKL